MANSINTNLAAYYAQNNISRANSNASSSISRLSSGNRIVKASDDVAALSVGTSLRTQVSTLRTALINANQGSSLLQVADGAMAQVVDILQRQKSIATQASSGSLTTTERGYLNQEFQALTAQIDQIASGTNFNGVNLLAGGLGTKSRLATTDALAALLNPASADANVNPGTASAASTRALQAFDIGDSATAPASAHGTGTGQLQITDAAGTALTNAAFDNVNSALYGGFDNFSITNVTYGAAAAGTGIFNATINGVTFSGAITGASTTAILRNGNSYIKLGFAAMPLTNAATAEAGIATTREAFKDVRIMGTVAVQGVNFDDTRLYQVKGNAASGIAMARVIDTTRLDISNFRYLSNDGAADTNDIAVTINGTTFVAADVLDLVDGDSAAVFVFEDGFGQVLQLDITGHNNNADNSDIFTNIRTSLSDREAFINALNVGFSRAGGGLGFGVGSTSADSIGVNIRAASSVNLFQGQSLSVTTSVAATEAGDALDNAIKIATSIRADIGGLQSRFNYASSNLESSIQNQDAARGVLLDTDVAAESTSFATSQVQLQAGISVLAQANLLTQNLLKLIG